MSQQETERVVNTWFQALDEGDIDGALACLSEDIIWENIAPVPGVSDVIPWTGAYRGRDGAATAFRLRDEVVDVRSFKLLKRVVQDDWAVGIVHDVSVVKSTGKSFDIEFASTFQVAEGVIIKWKSYCDSAPIVAAFRP